MAISDRIWVLEQDDDTRELLIELFTLDGSFIDAFASPAELLANATHVPAPSVAVVDAFTAIDREVDLLRLLGPRVVVLTSIHRLREIWRDLGVSTILTKPWQDGELERAVWVCRRPASGLFQTAKFALSRTRAIDRRRRHA